MDEFLEVLRRTELEDLRPHFSRGQRVLEIGGGSGFQAEILSQWGLDVISLDVPDRPRAAAPHFPVRDYDGRTLPFPDKSFDRVFSSNVLEHVKDLDCLIREMRRVLTVDGLMIHVLPSSAWRFWTSISYYPHIMRILMGAVKRPQMPLAGDGASIRKTIGSRIMRVPHLLVAEPHGEYPSALSELYYFSRPRWRRVFESAGLHVAGIEPTGLFYTGYVTTPLQVASRRRLARVIGSAATTFLLRPTRS